MISIQKFKSFLMKLPIIGAGAGAVVAAPAVRAAFDRGGEEEAAKVLAIELARMGDPGYELAWDVANVFPNAAKEIMRAIARQSPNVGIAAKLLLLLLAIGEGPIPFPRGPLKLRARPRDTATIMCYLIFISIVQIAQKSLGVSAKARLS